MIDFTKFNFDITIPRADNTTITFEVIDKDCDTGVETPRDLLGVVPSLLAYNANSEEIFNISGTISGIDNSIVNIPITALQATVYPTVYYYKILLDSDTFSTGELNVIENADYRISYP